jgi:hypothetical protein
MYVTVQMRRIRATSEQTLYSENFSIQLSDQSYIILTNNLYIGICIQLSALMQVYFENDTKQVTAQVKRTLLKI